MKLGTLLPILALITAPACGGGGSGAASGGPPPSVAASFVPDQPVPAPKEVVMVQGNKTNDVVTVNVTLTGTSGVSATTFEVLYDSVHTVCLGFAPGTVFEQGGAVPIYQVDWTSVPGDVFVTVTRKGTDGSTSVSGTMNVVGLQFRVKQAGVYPVTIERAVVYDGQPLPQPISGMTWFAGAVTGA